LILLADVASADPPARVKPDAVTAAVQTGLVAPWTARQRQRAKFSRARMPPSEARARVLDKQPQRDAQGSEYYSFSVDTRFGKAEWNTAAMTGCIYPGDGAIYVKRGEDYRTVGSYLGKDSAAAPLHACRSAAADT